MQANQFTCRMAPISTCQIVYDPTMTNTLTTARTIFVFRPGNAKQNEPSILLNRTKRKRNGNGIHARPIVTKNEKHEVEIAPRNFAPTHKTEPRTEHLKAHTPIKLEVRRRRPCDVNKQNEETKRMPNQSPDWAVGAGAR